MSLAAFSEILDKRRLLVLLILFLVFLVLKWGMVYFNESNGFVIRYDGYIYLLKALEITKGDWAPIKTHAIGWPIFLAPFFYFFASPSIYENMLWVTFLYIFTAGLVIFPLAYLSQKTLPGEKSWLLSLFLFIISDAFFKLPWLGFAEPLFTLFLLISICFIFKAKENPNYILLAATFAGLSYWVKPQGLVSLIIVLLGFFFLKKMRPPLSWRYLVYIILLFFLIAAPFLYQRYIYFGSAFSYGENDKFLVDNYEQLWGKMFLSPTLTDFFSSGFFQKFFNKFFFYGLLQILAFYILFIISPVLLLFFFWGVLRNRDWPAVFLSWFLLIWLIIFIPVFAVLGTYRYLYHTLPVVIILATAGIIDFLKITGRKILLWLILLVFLGEAVVGTYYYLNYDLFNIFNQRKLFRDNFQWAREISQKIRGKLAIGTGADLIMMNFPDTAVGGRGMFELAAPLSGLSIIYPGLIPNLDSAMKWLKKNGVTHLAVDDNFLNETAWRRINLLVYSGEEIPSYFQEVYSNRRPNPQWRIQVFKIDWDVYKSYTHKQ